MTVQASSIALGFFDGVHIAHRTIIETAVKKARGMGIRAIALTFDIPPAKLLRGEAPPCITTNEEKSALISALGAQMHALHTDSTLLNMPAEDFVKKILVEEFSAKHVVCGYNYHFGSRGLGNAEILKKLGEKYGFETDIISETEYKEQAVSSSRIRSLIMQGDIEEANILLGRPFSISGIVAPGKKLGRTIGFPTANVYPPAGKIVPRSGVYETVVTAPMGKFRAITNTGINPTLGGETLRTETYIPSVDCELYGMQISVEFIRFIRPEKQFSGIEELKNQIKTDVRSLGTDI